MKKVHQWNPSDLITHHVSKHHERDGSYMTFVAGVAAGQKSCFPSLKMGQNICSKAHRWHKHMQSEGMRWGLNMYCESYCFPSKFTTEGLLFFRFNFIIRVLVFICFLFSTFLIN